MARYAYKVVTQDMRSLGLRSNPTILTYEVGVWIKSPPAIPRRIDSGGMWAATTLSGARGLQRYALRERGIETRIFLCELGKVLREKPYRIQTDKVRLLEEII